MEKLEEYRNTNDEFKITILDKFILSQVFGATIVCLILFIIVWIAPETLFKIIKKVLRDVYTPMYAFQVLIYEIPKVLAKAIPVGILLGSIFTFDRLSKNSELAILRGIGLSFNRPSASDPHSDPVYTEACPPTGSPRPPLLSRVSEATGSAPGRSAAARRSE